MKLEKIEINGFKSFADKTEVLLDGSITGIIGPNGSGKSNIADAVRWVLGEQSSKNLRGTKMEDVIFGGTQDRRQKAYCEVSLYFDNSDMRINADYSEIVITRKMYRSGESEYYMNRNLVRLKDILDVVRDTGIGREGYSIVGQGKIDEILSAKPGARRKVFEEAAGVMKFRARKEEAENKLNKTQENLIRIGDILEELNAQIGPLAEQAEKTRLYQSLFERQKFLDANLFLINHERVAKRKEKLASDLQQLEQEIFQDKSRHGDSMERIESLTERIRIIEQSVSALREQYEEQNGAAEEQNSLGSIARERRANTQKEIARLQGEQEEARNKAQQRIEEKIRLQQERDVLQAQLNDITEKIEAEQQVIRDVEQKREDHRILTENTRKQHIALLQEQKTIESTLAAAEAKEAGSAAGVAELQARMAAAQQACTASKALYAKLQETVENTGRQMQAVMTQNNENRAQMMEVQKHQKELAVQINETAAAYKSALSNKQLLEKLKQQYDGYSQSVKNLMRELGKKPQIAKGVLGTLAELIEVGGIYDKAMEAVLGGALQNVVVQSEEDAKAAIGILRSGKLGRVSFMPLRSLRVRTLSRQEEALLDAEMLRADKAVQCDDAVRPAVEFLLARTVIVKDMDTAIALARKAGQSFRIVSLEGDVINSGGVITGGSQQQKNIGLLSREREIETYGTEAAKNQKLYQKLQADSAELSKKIEILQEKQQGFAGQLQKLEITRAEQRAQLQNVQTQIDNATKEAEQSNARMQQAAKEASENSEHQKQLQAALKTLEQKLGDTVVLLTDLQQQEQNFDQNHAQQLAELQVQQAKLQGEAEYRQNAALAAETEQTAQEHIVLQKTAEMEDLAAQEQQLQADADLYVQQQQMYRRNAQTLHQQIEKEEAERMLTNEKLTELQKQSAAFHVRQTEMTETKYKLDSQLERLTMSMEASQEKLWEEYGLTLGEAEKLREPINYAMGSRELQDIRVQIRDLGPINPNAIEDHARISSRAAEMTTQRDDLQKAKEDLEILIADILSSMKVVFSEKFTQINENFGKIFKELFGGGKAEISLTEGDIMECGIEISAEPPGKKLQHISLLSGGERALTGIALLFAMIRINPAPLCLLDEIDAPLDEANVVRFGNYIRKIEDSQFVVITHRKPTMAICQVLFGVTMEEKGVSRLVSVKMEEQE